MSKLDVATAQDVIERALEVTSGQSAAVEAKPAIAALLDVLRQRSHAAGHAKPHITGISITVHAGDDVVFQIAPVASGPAPKKPTRGWPVAYGGPGFRCDRNPGDADPPTYTCTPEH